MSTGDCGLACELWIREALDELFESFGYLLNIGGVPFPIRPPQGRSNRGPTMPVLVSSNSNTLNLSSSCPGVTSRGQGRSTKRQVRFLDSIGLVVVVVAVTRMTADDPHRNLPRRDR